MFPTNTPQTKKGKDNSLKIKAKCTKSDHNEKAQ